MHAKIYMPHFVRSNTILAFVDGYSSDCLVAAIKSKPVESQPLDVALILERAARL
jgi:hypothetical protein